MIGGRIPGPRGPLVVALALVLAAGALAPFPAWAKKRRRKAKPAVAAQGKGKGKGKAEPAVVAGHGPTLHLRALDLIRRRALVELTGVSRDPLANYFTFTDVRGRHFVANAAHCQVPFPSGVRVCELEIPAGYERHRLARLGLHLRSLHGPLVSADLSEVASMWEAAVASAGPALRLADDSAGAAPPDPEPRTAGPEEAEDAEGEE